MKMIKRQIQSLIANMEQKIFKDSVIKSDKLKKLPACCSKFEVEKEW